MSATIVHRTPLDVATARTEGLARLPFAEGLFKTTAATASLESQAIETAEPFDDLVGSWNADLPDGTSLRLQAQARLGSAWTPWFDLALARGREFFSVDRQENEAGYVDVDTLKLKAPASAFRYRVLLKAGRKPAVLRLVAVAVSNGAPPIDAGFAPGPWVRELDVPGLSQMEAQEKYRHDICSPTSLAMVLSFWGKKERTVALAEEVRDGKTQIFGHWPFNVAVAGRRGLEAYVGRLEMAELERELADGRPVVVSITFGQDELAGAPIHKTNGHLVVVSGFTETGDVIVRDPAAKERSSVRRVYRRAEFLRAWRINKRGLAYLIGPLRGRAFSTGVAALDLWSKPRDKRAFELHDEEHLSQLLYGEPVTAIEARGDWVKVRAEEQESERGEGYIGWVRASGLLFDRSPSPDTVIRTRQALLHRGVDIIALSVGTRLRRASNEGTDASVRLTDGTLWNVAADALYRPPSEPSAESRSQIVKTAELFLGTSYYWGGRSGVQPDISIGVDCSGLVSLAYRVHGRDVPRDAHEQKLRSRPIPRAELKPGDLVFLTKDDRSDRSDHVMIYTGGDGIIESRKSSGRVLRSSFKERFGQSLTELESGAVVTDLSLPKPRKRLIHFGTYF